MDVSIAVSLIRGQMGAVVERAVNGAVETVLAEMLKVVGVKFEELKAQVALMKQNVAALQREKALKEKENDNIRAKLRYTELKLKYYRQGVEEELQQRASASAIVCIDPSKFHKGNSSVCSIEKSSPCTSENRTLEGQLTRSIQESTPPQRMSRCAVGVRCDSDAGIASSSVLLPVTTSSESVDGSGSTVLLNPWEKKDTAQRKYEDQDRDVSEWTATLQLYTTVDPPPAQALAVDQWQQPVTDLLPAVGSPTTDSSARPSALQVKQEADEVICIKEEPEDEQELMVNLLDCQIQQPHLSDSQAQSSLPGCSEHTANQKISAANFSSARPSTYVMPGSTSSIISVAPNITPHQAARPRTKDLTLYEEYKIRRNEVRRRNLNRRRELETLPQPLLADMVRERREKTRLRVARWRAKRKLQACLNQAQALGGAAELNQSGFQPPRVSCAATSRKQNTRGSNTFLSNVATSNSNSASPPFVPCTASSVLCRGPNMTTHQL